jgi:hypothetical protein
VASGAAAELDLVPQLKPPEIADLVSSQLSLPDYLAPCESTERATDRVYRTNEDLWRDVLNSQARAAKVVTLKSFLLSEWLPFSAGVFHTDHGRHERESAQQQILYDPRRPDATRTAELNRAVPGIDRRSLAGTKVYTSAGKGGMIAGGIGSVRLKPRAIDVGEVWFMSASSTMVAHEGFPLAVPSAIYNQHADELTQSGAVQCTLTGELRFVESTLRRLYGRGVPQLYLLVHSLSREPTQQPGQLRVSIPVSFQSHDADVHVAYANFRPGEPGSLKRATEWLAETYVGRIYNGRVVTDFDEQIRWFEDADFSLEKVMSGRLGAEQARSSAERLQLGQHMANIIVQHVQLNGTLAVERIETVHQERVIQIGAGAQINAPITIADSIENSFNTIQDSSADDQLKAVLRELTEAVAQAAHSASPEHAAEMGRDLETLAAEATSAQPRRRWYELSLEALRDTARTLGEVGVPVVELTAKIGALLP